MSRHNPVIIFIMTIVAIIIAGCSQKTPMVKIGKKSFANEDLLIMQALEDQRLGNYQSAITTFDLLYQKSKKINYLQREAMISLLGKDKKKTYNLLINSIKLYPKNLLFKKLLTQYYLQNKNYKNAEKMALKIVQKDKTAQTLSLVGDIYMLQKSYKLALKYYQSSFKLDNSPKSLLNMVNLMYKFLGKKQEAISYLETYIRLHDANKNTYFTLLRFYGEEKNINGLISTYKKLYKEFKVDEFAKKTIELLMYKKDKKAAIKFLKKSGYNPKMLLIIYSSSGDYNGAYKVAKKLYKKTKNVDFLGKMAIFEYEANRKKLSSKILKSVSKKFETVLKDFQNPLYLNYYGYLLIDHNLDIKKGVKLVKRALEIEPKSLFYLDSLAWGYYKLNKCKKAYKIIEKFAKDSNEPEVVMHYKKILRCIKESK
ncbi:MAG: hypothetical protein L3J44_09070 [Campylobacteraceae bacterium]|nr:hypothetical protein [Campylobacteraceae bacterium]